MKYLICAILAVSAVTNAGTINPNGPVIFFDSFETPVKFWNEGGNTNEKATRPGMQSRRLRVDSKKNATTVLDLNAAGAATSNRFATNTYRVAFSYFCKDVKEVRIDFSGYVAVEGKLREDKWEEVEIELSQGVKDKKHTPAEHIVKSLRITFVADKDKTADACIDDFVIVAGGPNSKSVLPGLIAADAERIRHFADIAKDGFLFTDEMEAILEAAVKKPATKPNSRTVIGFTTAGNAEAVWEQMKASMPKRTLSQPTDPPGLKLSGFDDLRLFFPYSVTKDSAEYLVIVPSANAGATAGQTHAPMIARRCLDDGIVPVWVIPPITGKPDEAALKKLDAAKVKFIKELQALGVTCVDTQTAIKGVPNAMNGNELNESGLQAVGKVVESALLHIDKYVRSR